MVRIGPVTFLRTRLDEIEQRAPEVVGPADDATVGRAFDVRESVRVARLIVDQHGTKYGSVEDGAETLDYQECRTCARYPCPTLRLMLSLYDQHPDYDEDWAP